MYSEHPVLEKASRSLCGANMCIGFRFLDSSMGRKKVFNDSVNLRGMQPRNPKFELNPNDEKGFHLPIIFSFVMSLLSHWAS